MGARRHLPTVRVGICLRFVLAKMLHSASRTWGTRSDRFDILLHVWKLSEAIWRLGALFKVIIAFVNYLYECFNIATGNLDTFVHRELQSHHFYIWQMTPLLFCASRNRSTVWTRLKQMFWCKFAIVLPFCSSYGRALTIFYILIRLYLPTYVNVSRSSLLRWGSAVISNLG